MTVYFIQNKSTRAVKIGFTDRKPESRLKDLQTGCDGELAEDEEAYSERIDHCAWVIHGVDERLGELGATA